MTVSRVSLGRAALLASLSFSFAIAAVSPATAQHGHGGGHGGGHAGGHGGGHMGGHIGGAPGGLRIGGGIGGPSLGGSNFGGGIRVGGGGISVGGAGIGGAGSGGRGVRIGAVGAARRKLYTNINDYAKRLRDLEREIREQPASPGLHFLLGWPYAFINYPREAITELDKAIELAPDDAVAVRLRDMMQERVSGGKKQPEPILPP